MSHSRRFDRPNLRELEAGADALEETRAAAEDEGDDVQLELVDEPRRLPQQSLGQLTLEATMRKFINSTYVSLDGDQQALDQWHFDYWSDELASYAHKLLFSSGWRTQA